MNKTGKLHWEPKTFQQDDYEICNLRYEPPLSSITGVWCAFNEGSLVLRMNNVFSGLPHFLELLEA